MSHAATNWAIQRRGLRPATKLVLWHLCDRHNPDYGCFPSQAQLAADVEMSRSALNEHLRILEAEGLIRREQRSDGRSHKMLSTRYILGFEASFIQSPCPDSGHGNEGGPCPDSGQEPCPDLGESRVRNPDSNLVREPLRNNKTGPSADAWEMEKEGAPPDDDRGLLLTFELLGRLGGIPGPSEWLDDLAASSGVILDWLGLGYSLDRIADIIRPKAFRIRSAAVTSWAYFDELVRRSPVTLEPKKAAALAAEKTAEKATPEQVLAMLAERIKGGGYLPPSAVSSSTRAALLSRGLVSADELRARGIY